MAGFNAVFMPLLLTGFVLHGRREDRRATGWDAVHRRDVVRRAYAGELPADAADRQRLRRVLERSARDSGPWWIFPVALGVWIGLIVIMRNEFPDGWWIGLVAYYASLAGPLVPAMRRRGHEDKELLERLAEADVRDRDDR